MLKSLLLKLKLRQIVRAKKREIANRHFEASALLLDREKAIRKKLGMANTSTTTPKWVNRWEAAFNRLLLRIKH